MASMAHRIKIQILFNGNLGPVFAGLSEGSFAVLQEQSFTAQDGCVLAAWAGCILAARPSSGLSVMA